MDMINLNSVINHCIGKTALREETFNGFALLLYLVFTKYILLNIYIDTNNIYNKHLFYVVGYRQ
jgi:hypothetical protein